MRSELDPVWERLSPAAWAVRDNAVILGRTRVGAALFTKDGQVFSGCNIEHKFRSHDIHAEVNAIGSMVAGGESEVVAILVVAERERFTPCGACMDWIFEFGGPDCLVGFQGAPGRPPMVLYASELMPHYPR